MRGSISLESFCNRDRNIIKGRCSIQLTRDDDIFTEGVLQGRRLEKALLESGKIRVTNVLTRLILGMKEENPDVIE